jgi:hypothetical protein
MPINSATEVRENIFSYLRKEVFGPARGHAEVIPSSSRSKPVTEYITGVLYPQAPKPPELAHSEVVEEGCPEGYLKRSEDDTNSDTGRGSHNARQQSSCGITFTAPKDAKTVKIEGSFARYVASNPSADGLDYDWTRIPLEFSFDVDIGSAQSKFYRAPKDMPPDASVHALVRELEGNGRTITVTLVNDIHTDVTGPVPLSGMAFFQVVFSVSLSAPLRFIERQYRGLGGMDEDRLEALLLHLHSKEYAIGHGCAAQWSSNPDGPDRITAEFLPHADVLPLDAPIDRTSKLLLTTLKGEDQQATSRLLSEVADKYEQWINQVNSDRMATVPVDFSSVAARELERCQESLSRIRGGISELADDPDAFLAFRLANEAMVEVLRRSDWERKAGSGGAVYDATQAIAESECVWRPFQLAFVLQCIKSITQPNCDERQKCDLLWFPTGGGKTEAYLLLTAFTLYYRRLRNIATPDRGDGVAVLMRYTLRLLTVDQFVRASRMICAVEFVRRAHPRLKTSVSISIGMYVGGGATPNRRADAKDALRRVIAGASLEGKGSPCKLLACPWCNNPLAPSNYCYNDNPDSPCVTIACPNRNCDFNKDIPVLVVDDDVFDFRPSLVIGTIDKFAQLAFSQRAGNLFSTDNIADKPELIIQDELHLISGPLGTIAGLYEAAIDRLCTTASGVRPKVIASTATIRNAVKQVRNLFDREVSQFPPPFIDSRDSFFAKEVDGPAGVARSRRYVGLFAAGKSNQSIMIKSAGTLLQAGYEIDATDEARDPYWTLVGYFSSLRELGGAIVRMQDDVRYLTATLGERPGSRGARVHVDPNELTSRIDEQELVATRALLATKFPDPASVSSVLCSNMISVGLDIPRLSLMFMLGQPKTTAEYIQASSRVGRKQPGLVTVLYNPTRSRDRSFYEHFQRYHGSFYAEVEATSVTPFSSRARDRALHAAFVIIARHTVEQFAGDTGAFGFEPNHPAVTEIKGYLLDRLSRQDQTEKSSVSEQLDSIISRWAKKKSSRANGLCYRYDHNDEHGNLLVDYGTHDTQLTVEENEFPTMNQMRNVDAICQVYVTP